MLSRKHRDYLHSALRTQCSALPRVRSLLPRALVDQDKHHESDRHHRNGKDLAHGDRSKDKSQVLIRFTEKLNDQSADAVTGDEGPEDLSLIHI